MDQEAARHRFAAMAMSGSNETDLVEAQAARRVVYHGTVESFSGGLRAGYGTQVDGLLWTAPAAAIAQTYIPIAGTEIGIGFMPWELDDRVRPPGRRGGQSHAFMVACALHGRVPDCDCAYDRGGDLRSWRLPGDFPTNRQVAAFLQRQGYDFSAETGGDGFIRGEERDGMLFVRPAHVRDQGRLFVVLPPSDLRLRDLRRGSDGDLQDPDHWRQDDFDRAIADGVDGVVINDFCQTRSQGNVGHIAFGLTAAGLARCAWFETPAVNFDPGPDNAWPPGGATEDLRAAIAALVQAPAAMAEPIP